MSIERCPEHPGGGHMSSYVLTAFGHDVCRFCGELIVLDLDRGLPQWVLEPMIIKEEQELW